MSYLLIALCILLIISFGAVLVQKKYKLFTTRNGMVNIDEVAGFFALSLVFSSTWVITIPVGVFLVISTGFIFLLRKLLNKVS